MKWTCSRCHLEKEESEFYRHSIAIRKGWTRPVQYACKACCSMRNQAVPVRRWRLKTLFGITLEDYDAMFQAQDGCCAICGATEYWPGQEVSSSLAVDHNHDTGRVRGLLCRRCNQGIGMFEDSPEILQAAAKYLETHDGV